jgi:WhiB family transcriptional regulator, redox-sensing transcriptional regulator
MALTWIRPASQDSDTWRTSALCRHADPDLFFPVGTTGTAIEHIEAAKAVCERCPVKEPCLQFAIETNQENGVWGATSEEERRALRRAWVRERRDAARTA